MTSDLAFELVDTDFSTDIQDGILWLLTSDIQFVKMNINRLNQYMFSSNERRTYFKMLSVYYDETKTNVPALKYIKDIFDGAKEAGILDDTQIKLLADLLGQTHNTEFVLNRLDTFVKRRAMEHGLLLAKKLISERKFEQAKETFDNIFTTTVKPNGCINVLDTETVEERLQRAALNVVSPTGILAMDADIKGLCRTQMGIIMARLNVGKSWCATHIGVTGATIGKNVLHICTEMIDDRGVYPRYVQAIACCAPKAVANYNRWVTFSEQRQASVHGFENIEYIKTAFRGITNKGGNLLLKGYPPGTFSYLDLENLLKMLRAENKFPDIIIVDDLLNMKSASNHTEKRHDLFDTAVNLSRIAKENDTALWLCHQANRSAWKVKTVEADNSAEDLGVMRIADFGISINQTKEEYQLSTARIYIMRNRTGIKETEYEIQQDYGLGQFCIASQRLSGDNDE